MTATLQRLPSRFTMISRTRPSAVLWARVLTIAAWLAFNGMALAQAPTGYPPPPGPYVIDGHARPASPPAGPASTWSDPGGVQAPMPRNAPAPAAGRYDATTLFGAPTRPATPPSTAPASAFVQRGHASGAAAAMPSADTARETGGNPRPEADRGTLFRPANESN